MTDTHPSQPHYMNRHTISYIVVASVALLAAACTSADDPDGTDRYQDAKSTPLTCKASHPRQAAVATATFNSGDRIGLYVAATDSHLELGGNLVNNAALTYNGTAWTSAKALFWDEGTYNAFAYYPYRPDISSIEDQPFSVATDQSTDRTATALGGYEASDLLYASARGVSASAVPLPLTFRHIMSRLKIRLIKGEDFDGAMPTDAAVYVHSTVTSATLDLEVGAVTRAMRGTTHTIRAHQDDDYVFSAIVVPQRLTNHLPLVEVVMNGVSYIYDSRFVFKPGTEHLVNFVISNNPEKIKIDISGEIENWQ